MTDCGRSGGTAQAPWGLGFHHDARHGGGHARWARTGAPRHDAAYAEARAALLLGQMVHDRRTALGLTQAGLAARAGMTQPQLSRLELGGATPTVPLLARLAEAMDAELDIAFRPNHAAA